MDLAPTLRVLRSEGELLEVCSDWERLWLKDQKATPFQHPAWLLPWWRQFGQPDLRVGSLWLENELIALLPLYVLEQPTQNQLLLLGAGTSDYLDAVVSQTCSEKDIETLLQSMLDEPGWDVAHLTQLRQDSRLKSAMDALRSTGWTAEKYAGEPCSGCPASAIGDLPSKLRADVRYYRNAAIGQGRLVLRQAAADELESTFSLLVRFHTERWQQAGEAGVLADPLVLAHHRQALPQLDSAGLLHLMILELAGEPIAVLYSLIDPAERARRAQYFYLMGYALEHAHLRPGVLLTALASEYAAAEGIQAIDMLRGEESYKQFWRVKPLLTTGFAIEPNRPRS